VDALGRPRAFGRPLNSAVDIGSCAGLCQHRLWLVSSRCAGLTAVRDRGTVWYHTTVDQPLHLVYTLYCIHGEAAAWGGYLVMAETRAQAEDCKWMWDTWATPFGQGLPSMLIGDADTVSCMA
jgi:hypothetical protein